MSEQQHIKSPHRVNRNYWSNRVENKYSSNIKMKWKVCHVNRVDASKNANKREVCQMNAIISCENMSQRARS